ncbi:VOC family protein [Tenuibacillus multivorans]|uniref:Catechol 2,3-dioxygenase n=1 Tax=Tenuibacillus multivorans TaxID=237069 RepID=A0A1H0EQP4_9BACI|nr:VOC family protein [Tenuibacillus multivorans]GEL76997.1 catechol-2,3-dioxygenase [Tenuibacillus multivorans]SDN84692.1 catechol 2,3-dioxygenase [Tenuibacillus multivorans]
MGFHSKPTTFVGHVNIKVENLKRSLQFYQEIIGLDILEQTSHAAKLTADGKTSFLSLEQPEDVLPRQGRTTGLYHFALLLPKRSDLANFVVHLSEKGVRFGSSDHLVSEALYLHDPDGNEIEVYIDRDPSEWTWNGEEVAMTVDPLDFKGLLKSVEPGMLWTGMPEGTIMGHIHLHVSELIKTEEFYVKGLGFDVVNRFGGQALFLSTGKYHHHIGVNTWNGVGAPKPAENSVGMESFTLNLPNEEAIKETINSLQKIGVSVKEEEGRLITYDPSENRIELTV